MKITTLTNSSRIRARSSPGRNKCRPDRGRGSGDADRKCPLSSLSLSLSFLLAHDDKSIRKKNEKNREEKKSHRVRSGTTTNNKSTPATRNSQCTARTSYMHRCTSLPMQTPPPGRRRGQVNARPSAARTQPATPQWTGRGRPIA